MTRILGVLAALALATSLACGGMDIDEYAEECGDIVDDFSYGVDSPEEFEELLDELNSLSPPGDVKRLHDLRVDMLKLSLEISKKQEEHQDKMDDLQDEWDDASRRERRDIEDEMDEVRDEHWEEVEDIRDEIDDLEDEYEDEVDDLPRRALRALEEEDCI